MIEALDSNSSFVTVGNMYAETLAERFPLPSGYAQDSDDFYAVNTQVAYWTLRDFRYGGFEPIFSDCAGGSNGWRLAEKIVEHAIVMPDQARSMIKRGMERQQLVVAQTGMLALLTTHTHIKGIKFDTVTTETLSSEDIIDQTAIGTGYSLADFQTDIAGDLMAHGLIVARPDDIEDLSLKPGKSWLSHLRKSSKH